MTGEAGVIFIIRKKTRIKDIFYPYIGILAVKKYL